MPYKAPSILSTNNLSDLRDAAAARANLGVTSTASVTVRASDSRGTCSADFTCTGSNDQTVINAALAALPANGGSVILLGGTYNISGSIVIDRKSVRLAGETMGFWAEFVDGMPTTSAAEGVGATKIKASAATFPLIKIDNTSIAGATGRTNGVTITQLYLYGASKVANTSIGIVCDDIGRPSDMLRISDVMVHNVYDAMRLRIDAGIVSRCSVQDIGNDGVVITSGGTNGQGGSWGTVYPTVENNVIADIGGYGIKITGTPASPIVRGNIVVRTLGVYLDAYEWIVSGNTVVGGTVTVTNAGSSYQRGGAMTGNVFTCPTVLQYCYSATITGNRMRVLSGNGPVLDMSTISESVVASNVVSTASTTSAGIVQRAACAGNVVEGNQILLDLGITSNQAALWWDGAAASRSGICRNNLVRGAWSPAFYLPTTSAGTRVVADNIAGNLPVADNFTRADSATTLGTPETGAAAWAPIAGTWGISSNQAYCAAGAGQNFVAIECGIADVVIQTTVAGSASVNQGIAFRMHGGSAQNGYVAIFNDAGAGAMRFYKIVAGVFTQIGTVSQAISTGDVVKVSAVGNTLTMYRNGTQVLQITDSTHPSNTQHGLWAFGTATTASRLWDAFSIVAG